MRHFARCVITYEALGNQLGPERTPAFHAVEKLRPPLTKLMGDGGFRALILRALTLANAEIPWLSAVQVAADGSLGQSEDLYAHLDPGEFLEGRVVVVAHLLGLLGAFIGESLTLRLVREVWPEVPLSHLDFGEGGKHEKTK